MEQFNHRMLTGESLPEQAGIVGFDVLRSLIAARQAASPTTRALKADSTASGGCPTPSTAESLIALLAHGGVDDHMTGYTDDEAVIRQDERHA